MTDCPAILSVHEMEFICGEKVNHKGRHRMKGTVKDYGKEWEMTWK